MQEKEISQAVIRRMPRYYRYLGELLEKKMAVLCEFSNCRPVRYMHITAMKVLRIGMKEWEDFRLKPET